MKNMPHIISPFDMSLCLAIIQLPHFQWLGIGQCQAEQQHQHQQQQPLADEWLLRWRRGSKGLIRGLLSHPCFYPLSNRCWGEMDFACRRSGLMVVGEGGLAAPWTQPCGALLWAEWRWHGCYWQGSRRRRVANASGRVGKGLREEKLSAPLLTCKPMSAHTTATALPEYLYQA